MVVNLFFANNAAWLCFLLFFLIIDLYFSILVIIAYIYSPTVELVVPTGKLTNQSNAEIKTEPLTAETKVRNLSK